MTDVELWQCSFSYTNITSPYSCYITSCFHGGIATDRLICIQTEKSRARFTIENLESI